MVRRAVVSAFVIVVAFVWTGERRSCWSLIRGPVALARAQSQTQPLPQPPAHSPSSIVGAWTLSKDKSDLPATDENGRDGGERYGGRGGGGGGRGGGRRGGFGGGFGGGGFGGGSQPPRQNPEEMQRRMNALCDILQPPDRLTITSTESTVIVTASDGRTTRMATDGSKVKDDSTGVERRTKWQGDKLVSEISGAGPGKITETYAVDPDAGQLIVTLQVDGANRQPAQQGQNGQNRQANQRNQRRVYESLHQ